MKKILSSIFIISISLLFSIVIFIFHSGCKEEKTKLPSHVKNIVTVKDNAKPVVPELKITFSKERIKRMYILSELTEKYGADGMKQILAINRLDNRHIVIGDSLCIPDTLPANFLLFSPFPKRLSILDSVPKILILSYPVQAFGAYEYGKLVRWGPTSMGKRKTPTPEGLYFTNWKAKETISTVNEEWILPWAFNIDNFNGISIHEFDLPGYPASHSCARLLEADAEWFYNWADQWIVSKDGERIVAYGTPVIIYGKYNYHSPAPWKLLAENPDADNINTDQLIPVIKKDLPTIIQRKIQRDSLLIALKTGSPYSSVKNN